MKDRSKCLADQVRWDDVRLGESDTLFYNIRSKIPDLYLVEAHCNSCSERENTFISVKQYVGGLVREPETRHV